LPVELLGVKPTAPGWTEIEIKPYLADLNWAKGRVPTPRGEIKIAWYVAPQNKKSSWPSDLKRFEMIIEIPAQSLTRVFVPFAGRGKIKMSRDKKLSATCVELGVANGWAKFEINGGGKFKFAI
jgi:hypothetical protein